MKKLSILALALAALLTLSACGKSTTTSQQATVHQPNIDEITSNTTSDYASTDSDYSSATSSTPENGTTARPTKPEIPQVAAISPSKLEYEFITDGKNGPGIQINAINTAAEDIRFPDTIDGEPVVYINSKLKYSSNVKTLIFPDTVASCGSIPESVEFVKLPESFNYETYIFPSFTNCKNLKEVWIPDGITVMHRQSSNNDGIFQGCTSLKSICLPSGLTEIDSYTFKGCTSLESIYIPGTIKTIENNAFADCSSLKDVTIGYGVKTIEYSAFKGCTSLENIVIPDSVTSIAGSAFEGCDKLTSNNANNQLTIVGNCIIDCDENATSIEIPSSVTKIGDSAFSGCSKLTSITIPNSVTNIGKSAFSHCSSLTSITIPDSVRKIEDYTFSNCSSLSEIIIPNSITSIGVDAFQYCKKLESITIPDSVTNIDWGNNDKSLFYECTSLKNVVIGNGVKSIGSYAFYNHTNLSSITIGNNVKSIGPYAFSGCTNLSDIFIPNSVTNIGKYAFYRCSALTTITIPDGVVSIEDYAFCECISLANVIIPDSISSIGHQAFADTAWLNSQKDETVVLPNGIVITDKEYIQMPNLIGMTWSEATELYGDGIAIQLVPEYSYSQYEEGQIFEQDCPYGSKITKGTTVNIKVSKGIEAVEVPDLTGKSIDAAERLLRKNGFLVKKEYEESKAVAKNCVIRTLPEANEYLPRGSTVTIVVSIGSPNTIRWDPLTSSWVED